MKFELDECARISLKMEQFIENSIYKTQWNMKLKNWNP
jgi:hypothetical protein